MATELSSRTGREHPSPFTSFISHARLQRFAIVYARVALGIAFLSAVASRFGVWDGSLDLDHFPKFLEYAAQVNSFMPSFTIPFLAWTATAAELTLGVALVLGVRIRWTALAASVLLFLFATAMAISSGPKEPLDYSVYSASAGALLLALFPTSASRAA